MELQSGCLYLLHLEVNVTDESDSACCKKTLHPKDISCGDSTLNYERTRMICERGTRPWPHHRSIRSPRDPKRGRMRKSVKVSQRPRKGRERQSKAAQTLAQRLQRPGRGQVEASRGQERPGKGRAGREAEAVARNLNYFHPMLG